MWACSAGSRYPSSSARNSASVTIRTSLFGFSVVSFFARSSGVVVLVNAIVFPSGDHAGADAPYRAAVKREFDGLKGLYSEYLAALRTAYPLPSVPEPTGN